MLLAEGSSRELAVGVFHGSMMLSVGSVKIFSSGKMVSFFILC